LRDAVSGETNSGAWSPAREDHNSAKSFSSSRPRKRGWRVQSRIETRWELCPILILQSFQETQNNTGGYNYFVGETFPARARVSNVPKISLAMKFEPLSAPAQT